ncbi:G5 domain-containing protein [Jeotgalibaca sp. A122]|uniref:G5 domain-containing protein n=1 Tax=Jeotgalibaca sp. A122 TaxID=3457322 RepID=UPI003FD0F51A
MEKKHVYSIRKLKTGVSSVAIAAVMFGVNVSQASAVELHDNTSVEETPIGDQVINEENEISEETTVINDSVSQVLPVIESELTHEVIEDTSLQTESQTLEVEEEITDNGLENTERVHEIVIDADIQTPSLVEEPFQANFVDDVSGPVFKSVTLDQTEYQRGDTIEVTVVLEDESDIESVSLWFESNTTDEWGNPQWASVWVSGFEHNADGDYVGVGSMRIHEADSMDFENTCSYRLSGGMAYDIYLNSTDLDSTLFNNELTLYGVPDVAGPDILEITTDKENYKPGEKVEVTVVAAYENGVESISLYFEDELEGSNRSFNLWLDHFELNEQGNYVANDVIEIPWNTVDNSYKLKSYYATDSKGNYVDHESGNIPDIAFNVVETGVDDFAGPVVKEISFDKETYKRGEEIAVTVVVTEESDMDYVSLDFQTNETDEWGNQQYENVSIYDFALNENGDYVGVGKFRIFDSNKENYHEETIYSLSYGYTYDIYGNRTEIPADAFPQTVTLYGEPDVESPEIISIKTDKENYQPGERAAFTVEVADQSAVAYLSLEFQGEFGSSNRTLTVSFDNFEKMDSGNYVGQAMLDLPYYTVDNTYRIVNIYGYDEFNNYIYSDPMSHAKFIQDFTFDIVESGVTDHEGPVIKSISFNKDTYKRGEEIEVTVVATDDNDVEYISLDFMNDSVDRWGNALWKSVSVSDFEKNELGEYVVKGTFRITEQYEGNFEIESTYQIASGSIYDIYGNTTNIDVNIFDNQITVYGTPDMVGPEIISITTDKENYKPGETIAVNVLVADETGIDYLSLKFEDEMEESNRSFYLSVDTFEKDADGNYIGKGTMIVPLYTIDNTYRLTEFYAYDSAGNSTNSDSGVVTMPVVSFNVVDTGTTDLESPVVKVVSTSKDTYMRGEEVAVTVVVTDESEIERLELIFESDVLTEWGYPEYAGVWIHDFSLNENGEYEGTGTFKVYEENMTYYLSQSQATDIYGNATTISYEPSFASFNMTENPDKTGPELLTIIPEKADYKAREEIILTIKVSDESPVDRGYVYINEKGKNEVFMQQAYIYDFVLNEKGEYEGLARFRLDAADNAYEVYGLELYDTYGNHSYIDVKDAAVTFNVSENSDVEAPTLLDVSLDKKSYRPGDTIQVQIEAYDEGGVSGAFVLFTSTNTDHAWGNGMVVWVDNFVKADESGSYVGTAYIDIPADMEEGMHSLYAVQISDIYDNYHEYTNNDLPIDLNFFISDNPEYEGRPDLSDEDFPLGSIYVANLELAFGSKQAGGENGIIEVGNTLRISATIPVGKEYHADPTLEFNQMVTIKEGKEGSFLHVLSYAVNQETGELGEIIGGKGGSETPINSEISVGNIKRTSEILPFQIEYIYDDALSPGEEVVVSEGKDGFAEITTVYEVHQGTGEMINPDITRKETAAINRVIRIGPSVTEVKTETSTQIVTFEVEYRENPNLDKGMENVLVEGVEGIRTIVEDVTYVDGVETARVESANTITTAPINKVIERGTREVVYEEKTRDEVVSFETVRKQNPDLLAGTEYVSQEGADGVRVVVEKVTSINGIETDRQVISNNVTTLPTDKIIQVGTKALAIENTAKIVKTETRTESVVFETEYRTNAELEKGTEVVVRLGVDGVRTIVEEITWLAGVAIESLEISNTITSQPVNKVIERGTKEVVFAEETSNEAIPFEVVRVNNSDLLIGTEQMSQEGKEGIRTIIERTTYVNGIETDRQVISNNVTTLPTDKIIQVGVKAAAVIKTKGDAEISSVPVTRDNQRDTKVKSPIKTPIMAVIDQGIGTTTHTNSSNEGLGVVVSFTDNDNSITQRVTSVDEKIAETAETVAVNKVTASEISKPKQKTKVKTTEDSNESSEEDVNETIIEVAAVTSNEEQSNSPVIKIIALVLALVSGAIIIVRKKLSNKK